MLVEIARLQNKRNKCMRLCISIKRKTYVNNVNKHVKLAEASLFYYGLLCYRSI